MEEKNNDNETKDPKYGNSYMLFLIFCFITIESILTSGLIFIILGLSKFNKKELAGNRLYNPIVKKQLFCFVFIWILFYILIFEFNI